MRRNITFILSVLFLLAIITLSISTPAFALTGDIRPVQQSSLPQITFLGQGPQTFTVEPPLKFLVKTYQNGVFLFVTEDGPTYDAARDERVWTTNFVPAEPIRLFHESKSYGNVPAGCVVNYVQIEDNLDTRRNTFYINGNVLQVVEQGMVTYGTFTVPEAGELTFYAEDSIGMIVEMCQTVQTVAPSETPAATATDGATLTAVPFITETLEINTTTPTATLPAGADTPTPTPITPTATATSPDPSQTPSLIPTATATNPPASSTRTATATNAPQIEPTFTRTSTSVPPAAIVPTSTVPPASPVIVITATPVSTPAAIPVTGGVPGPREIAYVSAAIIGLFGVLGGAWWLLLRAYKHGR